MSYIIQQTASGENRYFIRQNLGITTWGSKPGSAARYSSESEADTVVRNQLKGIVCKVLCVE